MGRMKTLACSVGLIVIAVAPVVADDHAPRSLRMRARPSARSVWSWMRWVQRIAQVTSTGGPPSTPDPTPASDPASPSGNLARLAEPAARTPAITVTGTLIHRQDVDSPTPASVVDRDALINSGVTNVGDVLQKLPAQ